MHGNKNFRKPPFHPAKIIFFAVVAIAFALAVGWIVMWLWNAILPSVANVKPLTYWQAVGLLVLSRILFGGFGGSRKWEKQSRRFQNRGGRWREKWMNMSEEERQEFKAKWKERCGK